MITPGRKFETVSGAGYRYSINGQEKEKELNENITTALFWEYDSRIGRRWNLDPKPNISISPYNCFAGNPIWYKDILGDTLDYNTNGNTEADIRSLIPTKGQQYFTFSQKGNVSFNKTEFNKLSRSQRDGLLADEGFSLVKDVIESDKNFWVSTTTRIRYEETDISGNSKADLTTGAPKTFIDNNLSNFAAVGTKLDANPIPGINGTPLFVTFTNLANTARGDEAQVGYGQKPSKSVTIANGDGTSRIKKYDGELYLAPGNWFGSPFGGVPYQLPRASIVYHELMENYLRVNGSSYPNAHRDAKLLEGNRYGNRFSRGDASYFILGR